MSLPDVVTRERRVAARTLLDKEKELTRRRDALNTERRRCRWSRSPRRTSSTGPRRGGLLDLFEGRRQLTWALHVRPTRRKAAELQRGLRRGLPGPAKLGDGDTTMAYVSHGAPAGQARALEGPKGLVTPRYSSYGFNYKVDN